MPSISVIMPMLNVEATIRPCIESVLHQSFQDIEILCVDGGSTDKTPEILKEYARYDPRITILHSEIKSYGHQVNIGMGAATGDYIGLVEADDYISTKMYELLIDTARRNGNPDIVKSGYYSLYRFEVGGETVAQFPLDCPTGEVFSLKKYRRKHYKILDAHPSVWSCIYRRDFLTANSIKMVEAPGGGWVDNPFFIETLCKATTIAWVNEPLYYYSEATVNSSSVSTDISVVLSRLNEMLDIIRRDKPNIHVEVAVLKRALLYVSRSHSNSNISNQYTGEIEALLKRFSPGAVRRLGLNDASAYYSFLPDIEFGRIHYLYLKIRNKGSRLVSRFKKKGLFYTVSYYMKRFRSANRGEAAAAGQANAKPIPTELHLPAKTHPRILLVASDNQPASGAFLSMSVLGRILKENYPVEPFIILPNNGTGTAVLDEYHLVYCLVPSSDWVVPIDLERTEAVQKSILNKKRKNELAIQKLVNLIQENEIDLVHINTTYSYVGAIAARRANIPYIWHIREFVEEDQGKTLWDRKLGNQLIAEATRVIAISRSIYEKYASIVPAEKLLCIYNGIDKSRFYFPEKEILSQNHVTFIMVGGFQAYKGHLEFAKACVEVDRDGFADFDILFVGKGDLLVMDQVKKVLKNGKLLSRAQFLGYQANVQDYLKKSDIAFTCSTSEAFGRTTVEAMLSGNLVIGANTSGTKELIRDGQTGYLYIQGDVHSLAETIKKALRDRKKSRAIASAGREEMVSTMTADINAAKIYGVYKEILCENTCL